MKEYIKPSMNVIKVETKDLLAISNFVETGTTDVGVYDEPKNPNEALSPKRRGSWGSLW